MSKKRSSPRDSATSEISLKDLIPEQEALLSLWRDKWRRIISSTEPASRKEAETGINLAYQAIGLKPPDKIVWSGSPLAALLAGAMISYVYPTIPYIRISRAARAVALGWRNWEITLEEAIGASVSEPVRDFVMASIRDARTEAVYDLAFSASNIGWAAIEDSVWGSVKACVEAAGFEFTTTSVKRSRRILRILHDGRLRRDLWRIQNRRNRLGVYDYFREVLNLRQETEPVAGLIHQAQHGGLFFPFYERICWAVERPRSLSLDENRRLHAELGPALLYPDGWSLYAWHGVRVPAYIIMTPQKITVQDIQSEQNIEIRGIKLNRYGLERYILDSGLEPVHQDDHGTLYRENFNP
ncbi:MAG: hypothetical protein L0Y56_17520, partial [Nitrospira sp.]|nr:hypothetical protein [Nitrospira sp.]